MGSNLLKRKRLDFSCALILVICVVGLSLLLSSNHFHLLIVSFSSLVGIVAARFRWQRDKARIKHLAGKNIILRNFMMVSDDAIGIVATYPKYSIPVIAVLIILDYFLDWRILNAIAGVGVGYSLCRLGFILSWEGIHGPIYSELNPACLGGEEGMIYRTGEVGDTLDPCGKVWISGEIWNAECSHSEVLEKGTLVRVIHIEGLTLKVERLK